MFGWTKLLRKQRDSWSETARLKFGLAVVVSVSLSGCGPTAKPTAVPFELLPAVILPIAVGDQASTILRIRVYVGADHRARVVGWEKELATVIGSASALLHRGSGVQLELSE